MSGSSARCGTAVSGSWMTSSSCIFDDKRGPIARRRLMTVFIWQSCTLGVCIPCPHPPPPCSPPSPPPSSPSHPRSSPASPTTSPSPPPRPPPPPTQHTTTPPHSGPPSPPPHSQPTHPRSTRPPWSPFSEHQVPSTPPSRFPPTRPSTPECSRRNSMSLPRGDGLGTRRRVMVRWRKSCGRGVLRCGI